jgi:AcrR family transcriptional regulator
VSGPGRRRHERPHYPAAYDPRVSGRASDKAGAGQRVPTLRAEQRDLTRRRLRDAALEVFERRGYAAATIDEIAVAAGASRATFYLHFKSKADVIRELVQTMPERDGIWDALSRLQQPSREEVGAWLRQVVELYDARRAYFLAVEQAITVEPELTEGYYRLVDGYVDQAAEALHEDVDDARVHALLLWVQLSRFCFLWRVRGMELDEERAIAYLTDIWHDALTVKAL